MRVNIDKNTILNVLNSQQLSGDTTEAWNFTRNILYTRSDPFPLKCFDPPRKNVPVNLTSANITPFHHSAGDRFYEIYDI